MFCGNEKLYMHLFICLRVVEIPTRMVGYNVVLVLVEFCAKLLTYL